VRPSLSEPFITWLEDYRRFWESSFDRLEERLQADEGDARGA
jgi:hypothetical protein